MYFNQEGRKGEKIRFVSCVTSLKNIVERQTYRQTDRQTDTCENARSCNVGNRKLMSSFKTVSFSLHHIPFFSGLLLPYLTTIVVVVVVVVFLPSK